MKFSEKFIALIDFFIPNSMLDSFSYGEKQKARLIVIAGFFGLFVPVVLIKVSGQYPDSYLKIFYFLWIVAFYALTCFKVFKSSLKVAGILCTFGLTASLIGFIFVREIIFSATFAWFSSSVLIGIFMLGWRWGLVNFAILFSALLYSYELYEKNGLVIPSFWDQQGWFDNLKGDQTMSFVFNTVMVLIFLYTKEKSEEELLDSQETVRSQQETLFKKSRMAELGEVSGGIAHEINNPMTVILAHAQKIKRESEKADLSPEKIEKMAMKIETTCKRIVKIIDGLKNYSRDASHDPLEKVNLKELLGDVKEIFQEKTHQRMISLTLPNDGDDIFVLGRYGQLYQVLVNLINNAIDAIGEADETSSKPRYIKVEFEMNIDDSLSLKVIDSGPGIDQDIKEKVFQPFFTTKPLGKGTGLGLSISYGLMKEQGGALFYERLGDETCFSLIIPLYFERNEAVGLSELSEGNSQEDNEKKRSA